MSIEGGLEFLIGGAIVMTVLNRVVSSTPEQQAKKEASSAGAHSLAQFTKLGERESFLDETKDTFVTDIRNPFGGVRTVPTWRVDE